MSDFKVVLAVDSFKGSASSMEIETSIEKGIRKVDKRTMIHKYPIADGGEGTVEALLTALEGEYKEVEVTGPYQEKTVAKYGIVNERLAVIEMAEASGLHLVKKGKKRPLQATTYGTGELIRAALEEGVEEIYIGLGGSATNDGGVGMAQALGVRFLDESGEDIGLGADMLQHLHTIDMAELDERVRHTSIRVLSDVSNPLLGENGASAVFGPQKGAGEEEVELLEACLRRLAEKTQAQLQNDWAEMAGAGAAGGLAFGLMAFCGAEMRRGIEEVLDLINIDEVMKTADLVITGEGKMDRQSIQGKAPFGVAKRAKRYGLPVIAVVGSADTELTPVYNNGIDLVIDLINQPMTLEKAMEQTQSLAVHAGETAFRAFLLGRNKRDKS
ncbi:glycerate kinase [Atopococcus tabaci]|uniref:glycerate kinase n=1 Tax=Atopococcus tabaci TaxID=269774 RepID=UPI000485B395|nr:glycerate kinase [Atopococcus tabaci]